MGIGVQVDVASYRDRDPGEVLDALRELIPVDMITVFPQCVRHRDGYQAGTHFCDDSTSDEGDSLDAFIEAGRGRGVAIYAVAGETSQAHCTCAGFSTAAQVDCFGRLARRTCVNNPAWRRYQISWHEDLICLHPELAGMMFMHERSGPLMQVMHPGDWQGNYNPGCFCQHCCRMGEQRGIDIQRARHGFAALCQFFQRPSDGEGSFVGMWRLLSRYPEILAWEQLQWDSLHDYRAAIAGTIRLADPDKLVGFHYQHSSSLGNVFWRAGDDPARIASYADWVKPSLYPACSHQRYRDLLDANADGWLRDGSRENAHDLIAVFFGRDNRHGSTDGNGFDADWVAGEARRMLAAHPGIPVYAGLGIGIPGGEEYETPDLIAACTEACLQAGMAGILFSRHLSEMPREYLRVAGSVLRRHGQTVGTALSCGG